MPETTILRTPWTIDDVLDRCVYALVREYTSPDELDSSVAFHAIIGNARELLSVENSGIENFLEQYQDRTFVTFGATLLHRRCLQAPSGSPRHRNLIWRLSKESRLWDIGLLERRIRYAYSGEVDLSEGMERLCCLYQHWLDTDFRTLLLRNKVGRLRNVLLRQIDRALREFPLFKRLQPPVEGEFEENGDIPELRNLDYCMEISDMDSASAYEQEAEERHDRGLGRHCHPSERPIPNFDRLRAHRRRNLILSSSNGPLGIGLDLQAILLAETLNETHLPVDRDHLSIAVQNRIQAILRDIQSAPPDERRSWSRCFHWNSEQQGSLFDRNGYVRKRDDVLRQALSQRIHDLHRDINTPLDLPHYGDKMSLRFVDWLKYRNHDPFIKTWIDLEVLGRMQHSLAANLDTFQDYQAFPFLRSATAEVLAEVEEPFLHASIDGGLFVEIQLNDAEFRSALASNVALYGILPEMGRSGYENADDYPVSMSEYVINGIRRIKSRFQSTNHHLEAERALETALNTWSALTEEQQRTVIDIVVRSCMYQESAPTTGRRLSTAGISLDAIVVAAIRPLVWEFVVSCRLPQYARVGRSMPTSYTAPGVTVGNHSNNEYVIDPLKNALRLNDILLGIALDQLTYKMGLPRYQTENFLREWLRDRKRKDAFPWTIVNHLEKIGPKVGELAYVQDMTDRAVRKPDLNVLYTTNPLSCNGRVGPPIHYSNAILSDFELFLQDLPMQIAYALAAESWEVIWISRKTILVKLRPENTETKLCTIAAIARRQATAIFSTASISRSGFHDWLARGLCTCRVVDAWPNGNVIHDCHNNFFAPDRSESENEERRYAFGERDD